MCGATHIALDQWKQRSDNDSSSNPVDPYSVNDVISEAEKLIAFVNKGKGDGDKF